MSQLFEYEDAADIASEEEFAASMKRLVAMGLMIEIVVDGKKMYQLTEHGRLISQLRAGAPN